MTETVWGDLQVDQVRVDVTGVGSQPGPGGGDGWQIVARLPKERLQASRHYAFFVTGHIEHVQWSGATPNRGLVQVCLGDSAGTKHPLYRAQVGLTDPSGEFLAYPFQFLVLFSSSPSITDPLWGSTWSNAEDLVLWARIYRNGDPAAYSASCRVSMISWLWFDLDAIPSGSQRAEQYYPGSPALNALSTASPAQHFLTVGSPGSIGEQWLHFVNVWFTPRGNGAGPAGFEHGYVTDGTWGTFTGKVGTGGRWGHDTRGVWDTSAGEQPQSQIGGFFPLVKPSGAGFAIGFRGRDWHAVTGRATQVHRWRYLGLRIGDLPNVSALSLTNQAAQSQKAAHVTQMGQVFAPHEPGASTAVTRSIYLAQGQLDAPAPGQRSNSWAILTNRGSLIWPPASYVQQRGANEGVPVLAFASQGLGYDPLAVRYESALLRVDGEPAPQLWHIRDAHLVQLWLVQDPDILLPPVSPAGAPVVIDPGRESIAVGSLLDPPTAPDGATPEQPERVRVAHRGVTGYVRSWPRFVGMRRRWSLTWSVLRQAERDALDAFFRANVAFRWRPPMETSAVAIGAIERPRFVLVDPTGLWTCSLEVAELIYTL